ncbi:hypothetical protein STTU_5969 [Streptomyces sp. Tu6071]|nr:hypothetical protein STTU_5969 [Streptomyces sp. Tu6071]
MAGQSEARAGIHGSFPSAGSSGGSPGGPGEYRRRLPDDHAEGTCRGHWRSTREIKGETFTEKT